MFFQHFTRHDDEAPMFIIIKNVQDLEMATQSAKRQSLILVKTDIYGVYQVLRADVKNPVPKC